VFGVESTNSLCPPTFLKHALVVIGLVGPIFLPLTGWRLYVLVEVAGVNIDMTKIDVLPICGKPDLAEVVAWNTVGDDLRRIFSATSTSVEAWTTIAARVD
jgi:hypothetical protein